MCLIVYDFNHFPLFSVCGVIGTLQALEAIKIILNLEETLSSRILLFDGLDTTFRCIKLRKRKLDCAVCGINPTVISLIDYEQFCGSVANDKVRWIFVFQLYQTWGPFGWLEVKFSVRILGRLKQPSWSSLECLIINTCGNITEGAKIEKQWNLKFHSPLLIAGSFYILGDIGKFKEPLIAFI